MRYDDYTTVTAAAKRFGISPRHLRSLLQRGVVEGVKPSRDWLVRPSAVAEYLRRGLKPGPRPGWLRIRETQLSPIPAQETAEEERITIPEAARLSGYSRSHIRNLLRRGVLHGEKMGRDWVVTLQEVTEHRRCTRKGRPKWR